MSVEAISWVLKQDIAPSSKKFVLFCIANYADARGFAYPSMAQLEADTSQDRKTVLANVQRLVGDRLLRDSGERVGATRQVIVYQIVGLPESSRVHYVYRLTHPVTGEFYIGKRSFNGHPDLDQYRGSGRWPVAMKAAGVRLLREVIQVFSSDAEAMAFEVQTIREADGNALCRNDDTPARNRARQTFDPNSTENGTVEESQFSGETVPLFPDNGPEIPVEGSRKRDTEPSSNRHGTTKEKKAARKLASGASPKVALKTFFDQCASKGEEPIPSSDPVFDYARKVGIPEEWLHICWCVFRETYLNRSKIYADWRAAFREAVKRNYYGIWTFDSTNQCVITGKGRQYQLAHRKAA